MRLLKVSEIGVAAAVGEAATLLAQGRLVIIPTDTVYGVAADARLPEAVALLYRAKRRPRDKAIPLLAADMDAVLCYGGLPGVEERRLAERFWPGPLTLVLPVAGRGESRTEGFRVPDDEVTRALLRAAGGVLRATSANRSGDPPALTADAAAAALGDTVALVLDDGPARAGVPSSVARITDGEVSVLREGALSKARLTAVARGDL